MEIEYCMDVVKPCNLTRKRQAVLETCTDQRTNVGLIYFSFARVLTYFPFFLCSFFADLGCKLLLCEQRPFDLPK